jgi:hypothetical protein
MRIVIDEDRDEMFINDRPVSRILVYDLDGNFKRSFKQDYIMNFSYMYNFDEGNLIFRDYVERKGKQSFMILSKQDGSIIREIEIPFRREKSPGLISGNNMFTPRNFPLIPHGGNWILMSPSSDTVFWYSSEHNMTPFIARTPSIQSMDPEVFLFPGILTDRYYFMESAKKEYDFETQTGFPRKKLMYDRQEKTIYEYTVYNDDYAQRTENMSTRTISDEIAFWDKIEAYQLIEDYKKGYLKGRLKEIAAELDEEDNPVIMLVKHKKIK